MLTNPSTDPMNTLSIIILVIVVLVIINVLSCAYALGRFDAWKRDNEEE